ncbi:hypothetical protein GCM10010492_54780 [Saccharothrix mutabilis subsp. mutabilis]|uniref:Uncharacterized protein n=1 Tax=Saccharothrix mutabilis subsp. mutabilis TaxID=66855 RepID=A0ABN0UEN0_9PSEU
MFNGSNRYFLTAGHCGPVGTPTSANGTAIGLVSHATFPGADRAAVRVSNTAAWQQGPWGMTSAGRFTPDKVVPNKLRCLSHVGKENVSWFSLVTEALVGYTLTLWIEP